MSRKWRWYHRFTNKEARRWLLWPRWRDCPMCRGVEPVCWKPCDCFRFADEQEHGHGPHCHEVAMGTLPPEP